VTYDVRQASRPEAPQPPEDLTDRVFRYAIEAVYIVIGGVLWLLCSLPVVTLPAASAGLYALLTGHVAYGDRRYMVPFFVGFRAAFRAVTIPGLILVVLVVVTGFDTWYYATQRRAGAITWVLVAAQAILCVVLALVASVFFAMAGRWLTHREQAGPVSVTVALKFALAHPLWSVVAALGIVGVPAIFVWLGVWQFMPFTVGIIAYIVVRVVVKASLATTGRIRQPPGRGR